MKEHLVIYYSLTGTRTLETLRENLFGRNKSYFPGWDVLETASVMTVLFNRSIIKYCIVLLRFGKKFHN